MKNEILTINTVQFTEHTAVLTKRGMMYFGTWIDAEEEYFETAHFPDNLSRYPFQVVVAIYY